MNQQPYKKLYTYWFSVLIYDHTVKFCDNWIQSWKLKEQMTRAARSGKQNIVEGTDDMSTSWSIQFGWLFFILVNSAQALLVQNFIFLQFFGKWYNESEEILICKF